jgi:hypothetical protein
MSQMRSRCSTCGPFFLSALSLRVCEFDDVAMLSDVVSAGICVCVKCEMKRCAFSLLQLNSLRG